MIRQLLLPFMIFPLASNAQGFLITNEVDDIDSLLHRRVDISGETDKLFDFLTEFKYYEYDEINEFQKARQLQQNIAVEETLRSNWRSRYLLDIRSETITSNKYELAFFYLSKYDFNNESFSVSFDTASIEFMLSGTDRTKLRSTTFAKILRATNYGGTKLVLDLHPSQTRAYSLSISTNKAEILKKKLNDSSVKCDVAIELLSASKLSFETETYKTLSGEKYNAFCVLKITYKMKYFILKDYEDKKILEWREQ